MSIDVLGLQENQVFGTDKEKNMPTHLKWEDMPGETVKLKSSGSMTGREVLQYLGTDIFRSMYKNVWVNACLRQIQNDTPEIALISDVRFDNEIQAIQTQKGFVIGLTRSPYKKSDQHASETQIDNCLELCNVVIDKCQLSIPEQNKQIYLAIKHLDNIPDIFPEE